MFILKADVTNLKNVLLSLIIGQFSFHTNIITYNILAKDA